MVEADASDPSVLRGAGTRLWSHGEPRSKAALVLHGYTHTPTQVAALAERFFALGYNVFAPRAPLHGLTTRRAHARVVPGALRRYAAEAWTVTARLGSDAGVVGVSGGGVLATWLATRTACRVRRLLVLAPFYRPHPRRVPPAAVAAMRVLYGAGLLPDRFDVRGHSYTALAQYLRIATEIRPVPGDGDLLRVAVAVSAREQSVDTRSVIAVPSAIAVAAGASLGAYVIPAAANVGHDIVTPAALGTSVDDLYSRYLALYEG
ncbi:serine aminopeptidase domain-containing protein [Promicromonospora thailandica]|nr:alpha/beta hydrolase [Promicromonospora thailandica]